MQAKRSRGRMLSQSSGVPSQQSVQFLQQISPKSADRLHSQSLSHLMYPGMCQWLWSALLSELRLLGSFPVPAYTVIYCQVSTSSCSADSMMVRKHLWNTSLNTCSQCHEKMTCGCELTHLTGLLESLLLKTIDVKILLKTALPSASV